MTYTKLEEKQIDDLYNIVQHHHNNINIKHIDNITHHMVDTLYTNKNINHIHNKKTIAQGVLYKMFIQSVDPLNRHTLNEHKHIVASKDVMIDKIMNKHTYKPKKQRDSCTIL